MKAKNPIAISLRVEEPGCQVMLSLRKENYEFETTDIRVGEKYTEHLLNFKNYDPNLETKLRGDAILISKVKKDKMWLECASCVPCRVVAESQAFLMGAKPKPSKNIVIYNLLMPNSFSIKNLENSLKEANVAYSIQEYDYSSEDLTPRQREILTVAYRKGYFDVQRKITLTDLAKELGVNPSTLQEILRRGVKKVVLDYIYGEIG